MITTSAGAAGAKRGVGRPRRLTLDAIVDAACEIGLGRLEMNLVAERLNTGVATLYGYVRGREHLEHLVMQRLAADAKIGESGDSWQNLLREHAAVAFRTAEAQPHLIAELIEMEPDARESLYGTRMIDELVARGLAREQAMQLYVEVTQAVLGATICYARLKRLNAKDAQKYPLDCTDVVGNYRPTMERIIRDQEQLLSAAS